MRKRREGNIVDIGLTGLARIKVGIRPWNEMPRTNSCGSEWAPLGQEAKAQLLKA
jgi:hypothetical protein